MTPTPSVPTRRLDPAGIDLPVLSAGSWHIFDRIRFAEGLRLVETALDLGIRHFDVGVYDHHKPGFTDVIFGALMRAAGVPRDEYLLSYKLWLSDGGPGTLREQLERALQRGGVESVEFVVLGDIPAQEPPVLEELVAAMGELVASGLVGNWAVNNWSASTLGRTMDLADEMDVPAPAFAQLKYSVARRSIADGEPFAEVFGRGLALEASDVLEGGVLAGRTAPDRQIGKDPGDVRRTILAELPGFLRVAEELGASPAEVAIAFSLSHPHAVTTLFGASKPSQLHAAVRALDLLDDVGAGELRRRVEPFWADRGVVDPAA